ncbi:MAG TPA: C-type lectin domain-containing protein [Verrucomicrobiae bacterium]|jgi:hypothetical protein|nr:C-type lectin domain-containing protein [Verrucomicrobiae bacterium]
MSKRSKPIALFLVAFSTFIAVVRLFARDQGDSSERDATLQKAFSQFPLLGAVVDSAGRPEFQTLIFTNPVIINRERFFGFRFKVPTRPGNEDFVWAFVDPPGIKEWYIAPQTGQMDGFVNYYWTTKGDYMGDAPLFPRGGHRLILQSLPGDNLNDGQDYLIWFGFGNRNPPALSLAFTFAHFDPSDQHPMRAIEDVLSINQLASGSVVNPYNHHTYILLRPASWERSEKLAVKLGGHLATIRNQAEEDWVFKTFGRYGGTPRLLWIGLNDLEKKFHYSWTSGESDSYTDWAQGEPNNAGLGGEDYVAIFYPGHSQENKWNDWDTRGRDPIGLPMDGIVEIIPTNQPARLPSINSVASYATVQMQPNATMTAQNGNILLQWPVSASDYILEATTNLGQPFAMFGYSEFTNSETGVIYVTITNPSPQMFFRLVKPAD